MKDHTPYLPDNITEYAPWVAQHGLLQPYGKCQCGCGNDAPIARSSLTQYGWRKGKPIRYIGNHSTFKPKAREIAINPSGLCMCGCGQPAPIAKRDAPYLGYVRGQPIRFIQGHNSTPKLSVDSRFWAKVDKRGPNECWEWQGAKMARGYGKLIRERRYVGAHRISYELHHGAIPDNLFVLHRCDNPSCVNPAHLFVGTPQDNADDMDAKARRVSVMGESNHFSRLTEDQVRHIRELFDSGRRIIDISKQLSIPRTTVLYVAKRITWKSIP